MPNTTALISFGRCALCTLESIVGSCALYALLKPNALYALKNQKRTFNSRDQVKVTDICNTHSSVTVKFSVPFIDKV